MVYTPAGQVPGVDRGVLIASYAWEQDSTAYGMLSEADRISQSNKEFIRSLFPAEPIYTSLLPPHIRALIGQVGPDTRGVEKMLREVGFHYAHRIDPFDGGPHFTARTDEITLVQRSLNGVVTAGDPHAQKQLALACVERDRAPFFRAAVVDVELARDSPLPSHPSGPLPAHSLRPRPVTHAALSAQARALLGVELGDVVGILPL